MAQRTLLTSFAGIQTLGLFLCMPVELEFSLIFYLINILSVGSDVAVSDTFKEDGEIE